MCLMISRSALDAVNHADDHWFYAPPRVEIVIKDIARQIREEQVLALRQQ